MASDAQFESLTAARAEGLGQLAKATAKNNAGLLEVVKTSSDDAAKVIVDCDVTAWGAVPYIPNVGILPKISLVSS